MCVFERGPIVATRQRKKTVQFFEVVNSDGSRIENGSLDWQEILFDLSRQHIRDRRHRIGGIDHWGQIYPYNGDEHFILAKNREDGVSSFDIENEEFIDSETQAGNPYVELTIIKFIPGTNRFGLVLGSGASSRAGTFQIWLNEHRVFAEEISVKPLVSNRVLEKIQGAQQAKLLNVRLERDQAAAVSEANGLYGAVRAITAVHGSVDVELILRVKGQVDSRHDDERISILNTARSVINTQFSKAMVELVQFDQEGKPETETVNFVNDLLSKKMKVSVTDEEGHPVRIPSAIAAIDRAIDDLQSEFDAL
ncbi:hypothetical protein [Amycolatopsis australiensis]|uniref:Uncharacterized protein n=1 Tax=Amycolatopsis australiensis TaxID=546364 RepID=A0A1K1R3D9_9PSEU|nr:hypothetical protein [Amycolatopsis australiensis]SFW66632.1 hypothetical protein SAMN04489730_2631 [Amycolatopsis australiensis]